MSQNSNKKNFKKYFGKFKNRPKCLWETKILYKKIIIKKQTKRLSSSFTCFIMNFALT